VVEEDEGPDRPAATIGQNPADLEPAKVAAALLDDVIDHGRLFLMPPYPCDVT
jgi:hypothetical protein